MVTELVDHLFIVVATIESSFFYKNLGSVELYYGKNLLINCKNMSVTDSVSRRSQSAALRWPGIEANLLHVHISQGSRYTSRP